MGLEQRQESEGWLAPRLYEFPRHCSLPQTFPIPSYRTSILFSILPALTIPGLGKCVGNINFTHECIYTLGEGGEKCKRDGEEYTKQVFRNIATNFFLLLFLSLPTDFFFFYVNRERKRKKDSFLYLLKHHSRYIKVWKRKIKILQWILQVSCQAIIRYNFKFAEYLIDSTLSTKW